MCIRDSDRIVKRAFDLVLGLIGLIVSAPITLLVAAAIKLDDGGPVFYLSLIHI